MKKYCFITILKYNYSLLLTTIRNLFIYLSTALQTIQYYSVRFSIYSVRFPNLLDTTLTIHIYLLVSVQHYSVSEMTKFHETITIDRNR